MFSPLEMKALRDMTEGFMVDIAEVHQVTGGGVTQADLSVSAATTDPVYIGKARVRTANDSPDGAAEGEQVFTSVDVSFPYTVLIETDDLVNVTSCGDPYLVGWYVVTNIQAQGQHAVRRVGCRKLSENRLRQ